MSGLLVTWVMFKELDHRQNINLPLMYVHQYLRLTPAIAGIILFAVSLSKFAGNGPFYSLVVESQIRQPCEKYWWSALLCVQNYVNPETLVTYFSKWC